GLADSLMADTALGDYVKRLEQRMVTGAPMTVTELVENILQRGAVRAKTRGVVFGVVVNKKLVTFAIGSKELVDVDGEPYGPPIDAEVFVVHPIDLTTTQRLAWLATIDKQPFAQLERPFERFANVRAMTRHAQAHVKQVGNVPAGLFFALESMGWTRGPVIGG